MELKTWREPASEKKKFVIGMAAIVALVYLICILYSVRVLSDNRVSAELNHQARMSAVGKEQGTFVRAGPGDVLGTAGVLRAGEHRSPVGGTRLR